MTKNGLHRRLTVAAAGVGLCVLLLTVLPPLQSLKMLNGGDRFVMVTLFAAAFAAVLLYFTFRRDLIQQLPALAGAVLLLTAALFLRIALFDMVSHDYVTFLSRWVAELRPMTIPQALGHSVGDYNTPYLYILTAISRSEINDLYLIKFVSVCFDFALAVAVTEAVSMYRKENRIRVLAFGTALFYPAIWLNSAFWAQCDATYALFVLLSFIFACKNRPWLSVAAAALAFSFKLQTVFFLPVLLAFLVVKKIKWYHFSAFPAVFFAMLAPALIAGRGIEQTLRIYFDQAGQYSQYFVCLNAPTVFAWLHPSIDFANPAPDWMRPAGIAAAAVFAVILPVLFWRKYSGIEHDGETRSARCADVNRDLLFLTLLMVLGVVWLLPAMHDRYFYLADVFVIVFAFSLPRGWITAPFVFGGSIAGYAAYLGVVYLPQITGGNTVFNTIRTPVLYSLRNYWTIQWGAAAILLGIAVTIAVYKMHCKKKLSLYTQVKKSTL
jgi:Gpi18-like mannosyltransferase